MILKLTRNKKKEQNVFLYFNIIVVLRSLKGFYFKIGTAKAVLENGYLDRIFFILIFEMLMLILEKILFELTRIIVIYRIK
tara:strand:- start:562 stop:804 length:243 start_codon:yes stop_codon:yes gene_type:complete